MKMFDKHKQAYNWWKSWKFQLCSLLRTAHNSPGSDEQTKPLSSNHVDSDHIKIQHDKLDIQGDSQKTDILFSYEDALHRIKQNKHMSNESLFIYNLFRRQFVPIHRLDMQQSFSKVKRLHFWLASKSIAMRQSHFQRHLPVKQYPPGTRYHL